MAIRGFIFDLDGVITDTAEHHYRAWKQLADENGWEFDRAANEKLRGVSRRESLLLLLGPRVGDYTEAQLQAFMERKNNYYLRSVREISPKDILPGAKELVIGSRANGAKIALGSASKNARQVLDSLCIGSLFDAISDGNSVKNPKPAPDLFLLAAERMGVAPADCLVFEDSLLGITAAERAGMGAVLVARPQP